MKGVAIRRDCTKVGLTTSKNVPGWTLRRCFVTQKTNLIVSSWLHHQRACFLSVCSWEKKQVELCLWLKNLFLKLLFGKAEVGLLLCPSNLYNILSWQLPFIRYYFAVIFFFFLYVFTSVSYCYKCRNYSFHLEYIIPYQRTLNLSRFHLSNLHGVRRRKAYHKKKMKTHLKWQRSFLI